jgi:hypothetical protein
MYQVKKRILATAQQKAKFKDEGKTPTAEGADPDPGFLLTADPDPDPGSCHNGPCNQRETVRGKEQKTQRWHNFLPSRFYLLKIKISPIFFIFLYVIVRS